MTTSKWTWESVRSASSHNDQWHRSASRVSKHTSTSEHAQAAPWGDVKCSAVQVRVLPGPNDLGKGRAGTSSHPWGQVATRFYDPRQKAVHQEEGPCAGVQPQSHDEGAAQGCPFCTPQFPERVSSWKWIFVRLDLLKDRYHVEELIVGRE